jgi:hypothetical protein
MFEKALNCLKEASIFPILLRFSIEKNPIIEFFFSG